LPARHWRRQGTMNKHLEEQIANITVPEDALPFIQWIGMEKLTCRQAAILLMVRANPGCSVGAIAAVLGIDKPTISKTADKLTEWGLVHRQENLEDRRLVELWPGTGI